MADFIKKAKRRTNFTTVNNDYLQDSLLSWKAKGMITYIMSLPEDWNLNISDLKNRSKDGRDATANGIKELIENGYCFREKKRSDSGLFVGYNYHVSDCKDFEPKTENTFSDVPFTENPVSDNLVSENPISDNPTLVNTNSSNETIVSNTNSSDTPHNGASLFPDLDKEKREREKLEEEKRLAEEAENKISTLFRNSAVFKMVNFGVSPVDYSVFEKSFIGEEYEKIDLVYYFHLVSDWSDQKNMKRTKRGWLATVRNFIRGDIEKNKLKLKQEFKPENQKTDANQAIEYLNEYD